MPTNVNVPADAQRQRRARANYGQNAACKWVRKKAWRACDYTDDGHLRQFDTEEAFLAFEEERRVRGHSQAHYEKKPRDTVPEVQLALVEAITHAVAKDGNETRVQLQSMEEGIHERHDEHRASRARKNYGRNALGKFVRKKAFRECDYTPEGHLVQFDDEDGFISFEEGGTPVGSTKRTTTPR